MIKQTLYVAAEQVALKSNNPARFLAVGAVTPRGAWS